MQYGISLSGVKELLELVHSDPSIELTRDLATVVKQKTAHLPAGSQAYMHLGDGRLMRPIQCFVSHTWGGGAMALLESVIGHGERVVAEGGEEPGY